uniref:G domain-containing protein n=1 Tax=Fervidicoccus fontis TaxID=683846 RepID=A0A7J3ZIC1_9CREN
MTKSARSVQDEIRRLHLPQYDEIYAKTRNRVGRLLDRYKRLPGRQRNPRRESLEIVDTAYNVIKDKLEAYRKLYEYVKRDHLAREYVVTVYGDKALKVLAQTGYMSNRLTNLWRALRKQVYYYKDTKKVIRFALSNVARLVSYVKRRRELLEKALELKKELSKAPLIAGAPVVVIAGPPNAGKSTLARVLAEINTKVGEYPFTTKEPVSGVSSSLIPFLKVHVIDTPGLLAREKRNIIELKALAMLKMPGSIVIYLLDPDPGSRVSIEGQISLLREVLRLNPNTIVAVNKVDAWRDRAEELKREVGRADVDIEPVLISAITGEGVEELVSRLKMLLKSMLELTLDAAKRNRRPAESESRGTESGNA